MPSRSRTRKLIDAHCHLASYPEEEVSRLGDLLICAVSEDLESSIATVRLSGKFTNVLPFVGIHPWEISPSVDEELKGIEELLESDRVRGVGEVGLDRRFSKADVDLQLRVYRELCAIAAERGLPVNVHALYAWREALDEALRAGVKRALFHWYTGPVELLKEIEGAGYFISINPALNMQKKHIEVVKRAELLMILTESDAPYNYRGLQLEPRMVEQVVRTIASVKGLEEEEVLDVITANFSKYVER